MDSASRVKYNGLPSNLMNEKKFLFFKVVEQTLCPIWDECLLFQKFTLYSSLQYIANNAPYVTVQVYDFDKLVTKFRFYN